MESDKEFARDKEQGKTNSSADYPIPHGIEVLVKKASVDTDFRRLLLEKRAEAAKEIDLELDDAETAMLAAIPREQLEKIIDNTKVPPEQKKVFLSSFGRIMLATVIAGTVVVGLFAPSLGHTRDISQKQREYILERQRELERQIQEINEPDKIDSQAEADSNGQ